MALFGGGSSRRTQVFGQDAADALQPGLFDAWRDIMFGGGAPFTGELTGSINAAYARAAQEAGALLPGAAGQAIGSDVRNRGAIGANQLLGSVGLQGQRNKQNVTGQQAALIAALTAGRPQFSSAPDRLSRLGPILSNLGSGLLDFNAALPDAAVDQGDF